MSALCTMRCAAIAGAILLTMSTLTTGSALADPPVPAPPPVGAASQQASPSERAAALVRPSIVRLDLEASGWLRDSRDGKTYTLSTAPPDQPMKIQGECTGFGVNPNGYIATAGHCVDLRSIFVEQFAADQQRFNPGMDLATLTQAAAQTMVVEGRMAGSPPDLTVTVEGAGPQPVAARVVDFRPPEDGDVALLQIPATDLPSVQLAADANVNVGTPVLSVGYPNSVSLVTDPSLEPSVKNGEVSSKKTSGNVLRYEMSAPISGGMSGGPAVDLSGRVLGVNSFKAIGNGETQPFNFISPASVLNELLARNGVRNDVGLDDATYRTALDAYFAGRYSEAYAGFDRLAQINPRYEEATKYKIEAARARDRVGDAIPRRAPLPLPPPPPPSSLPFGMAPALFWSIIGVVGLLVTGAVIALVVRRNRRRAASSPFAPTPAGQYSASNPYAPPQGSGEASQVYAGPYPHSAPPSPPPPSR